jgi:probable rRNA maturation factor
MIDLTIVNRSGRPVPLKFLENWVKQMSRTASRKIPVKHFQGKELVIAFVTSVEIRRLNKQFRGKNKTTDVLSFESDDPTSLGELAIAPEVISRQAREHGLLVREELGYMVLHGFLHLLGYDHEAGERDAKKMFALQDEIFERLLAKKQRASSSMCLRARLRFKI